MFDSRKQNVCADNNRDDDNDDNDSKNKQDEKENITLQFDYRARVHGSVRKLCEWVITKTLC